MRMRSFGGVKVVDADGEKEFGLGDGSVGKASGGSAFRCDNLLQRRKRSPNE